MIKHIILTLFLLLSLGLSPLRALAQFDDSADSSPPTSAPVDKEVESLYDTFDRQESRRAQKRQRQRRIDPDKIGTLSELSTLEPFSDIAVIQRRFLPKTGRFEIAGLAMSSVNNPFFSNLGLGLTASYFFTSKHAVELQYYFMSNSERGVTANLRDNQNVKTTSLTTPKSYMGAAYKWNPIYGKMTLLNNYIVPFDLFFTVGGGLTTTDLDNQEATVHLSTGQVFALSKAMAIRWDLSMNLYQAEALDANNDKITNSQNDLFLMVGMSFYFPEATYR